MVFSIAYNWVEQITTREAGDLGPEFQRFVTWVLLPFCGLIVVTLVALFASQLWSAREANRMAVEASQELVHTGFQLALQEVGSNVTATATWDDAVTHMHLQHDQNWAIENIGNWATDTLHFEMTFIIDPQGLTRFSMVDGKVATIPIESLLGEGLQPLLESVRKTPLGPPATGVVRSNGQIVMVGAAAIHPHTDKLQPITGGYSILVYGDLLDASGLENLKRAYLLTNLRLVQEKPEKTDGVLPLLPSRGPPVAFLIWDPDRPGGRLLRVVLPLVSALVLAIVVLASFILLYARRAAVSLSSSRRMALTDSLTGLPNRVLFEDRLQQALNAQARDGGCVAALCLDLDGFKTVNDRYGHAAGDELLREVTRLLRAVLRSMDTLARIGGDEFVVLQTAPDRLAAEGLAKRMIEALDHPIVVEGTNVTVRASIGIAFADILGDAGPHLLRLADSALYEAKRAGGNQYRISQPFRTDRGQDQAIGSHGIGGSPTVDTLR